MECPKCGYERQAGDTHCEMCNLDFGLWERQTAEKKRLRDQARQKPADASESAGSDAGGLTVESGAGPRTEDPAGECPKCGLYRRKGDVECPHCGVIYAKHEQMLARQQAEADERKREEERVFAEEKARIQREAEKAIAEEQIRREEEARKQAELADRKKVEEAERAVMAEQRKAEQQAKREIKKEKRELLIARLKRDPRKVIFGSVAVVVSLVLIVGGVFAVRAWQASNAEKRLRAENEAARIKLAEEHRRIEADFRTNRDKILSQLRSLIDKRKFDSFNEALKKYDIPPLAAEVARLKAYLEEIKLVDKAQSIAVSEYQQNFEAYRQLARMNPDNKAYAEKMAAYRKKWAEQEYRHAAGFLKKENRYKSELAAAIASIDKAIELEGRKKRYNNVRSALKKSELLFYDGNDRVHMALRNDGLTRGAAGGQRKIYVWLKNVGNEAFFVNVDYFTLVAKNGKRYKYNDCSRDLVVELKPGEETQGYLYFYTSSKPNELIFNHKTAGRISRRFP